MAEVQSLFVKIHGIKGTAKLEGFKDYINIISVNFATFSQMEPDAGGALTKSGVKMSSVTFTKIDDFETDESLAANLLNGTPIPEVEFVKVTTNNGKSIVNRKVTLTDVCILMAETNMLDDGVAVNTYSLLAAAIKRESQTVAQDGTVKKVGPSGYSFVTAKAQ